jgi:hypothetical protein
MGHQVFEIEAVRKQVLDLLRKEGRTLTAGLIAYELGLPLWAVESGLESARVAGLASFTAGAGWAVAYQLPKVAQEVVQTSQQEWIES